MPQTERFVLAHAASESPTAFAKNDPPNFVGGPDMPGAAEAETEDADAGSERPAGAAASRRTSSISWAKMFC